LNSSNYTYAHTSNGGANKRGCEDGEVDNENEKNSKKTKYDNNINQTNNEELNEKIYNRYLEINKAIIQYSNTFKENYKFISQNDQILHENIVAKEKLHLKALRKRIESKHDYNLRENEKTELFTSIRLLSHEIKEISLHE